MKIVMVHGSWHWGACFQKVGNRLAEAGHAVAMPDLVSHGYDDRPYDSISTLAEYIEPVGRMVRQAKEPVVLVGHSMGGVALTNLAEKHPEKIAKLIYVSGIMVPKGGCASDYVLPGPRLQGSKELFEVVSVVDRGRGLRLDLDNRAGLKAAFYGDCTDHDIGIVARNALPINGSVPNIAVSDIAPERYGRIPRVYIECALDRAIPIETQRLMIDDVPGAKIVTMETSHSPFFSKPGELASIILDNVGG